MVPRNTVLLEIYWLQPCNEPSAIPEYLLDKFITPRMHAAPFMARDIPIILFWVIPRVVLVLPFFKISYNTGTLLNVWNILREESLRKFSAIYLLYV